jgi:hypothetical protein
MDLLFQKGGLWAAGLPDIGATNKERSLPHCGGYAKRRRGHQRFGGDSSGLPRFLSNIHSPSLFLGPGVGMGVGVALVKRRRNGLRLLLLLLSPLPALLLSHATRLRARESPRKRRIFIS